jgi:hypothetical protein
MTSLYNPSVPTFSQTVKAIGGVLEKANEHFAASCANPDDIVNARLIGDMAPFHFQIEFVVHHSVWALDTVKNGVFNPPSLLGEMPFSDLRKMIAEAAIALDTLPPEEVNGWSGKDLDLYIGPRNLTFTSETFLLSFAMPNFYFHAVTAYDILRSKGVPIGKRDFEGQLRTRTL